MTVRRVVLVVGAVVLIAGIVGLLVPVSVSDGNGGSIGCGDGVVSDLSTAREANNKSLANIPILNKIISHTDFVAECQSALARRRLWTIPMAVVGGIALFSACFVPRNRSAAPGGV
ncbi:MAG: aminopeptidase [Mycobacterium sp.]|nr:aminopeptidase [Mycobacterium sp.]